MHWLKYISGILFTALLLAKPMSIQSVADGVIFSNEYYSAIYHVTDKGLDTLMNGPGAARYIQVSPNGLEISCKEIRPDGLEAPVIIDLNSGTLHRLHTPVAQCGQISYARTGEKAFTIGRELHILTNQSEEIIDLGYYSNLVQLSPDGTQAAFNDANDNIILIDRTSHSKQLITPVNKGYFNPQWSHDGHYLCYQSLDGNIFVWDHQTRESSFVDSAFAPAWHPIENLLLYQRSKSVMYDLISSELYVYDADSKRQSALTASGDQLERDAVFSRNGSSIYFCTADSPVIWNAPFNTAAKSVQSARPYYTMNFRGCPSFPDVHKNDAKLKDIPYVHQVYDTPNWHNGHWSCAPTAAAMVLAYYQILPEWLTNCSSPYAHTNNWGRYICERYYFSETDFNYSAGDAGGNRSYGGYGYMWGLGSPNSQMANYYKKHGIVTTQTWTQSWSATLSELALGYPYTMCVMLTTSGHLIIAQAQLDDKHTLIFNDPYGNKNTANYPSYDGKDVYYDWPGYNQGFQNLNGVAWCITNHTEIPATADSLVDDIQYESGFHLNASGSSSMAYWKDKKSGYNNHFWYAEANNLRDIQFATWTPVLEKEGIYKVSVYIPAMTGAANTAVYKIHHQHGIDTVIVNQTDNSDTWHALGDYKLCQSPDEYLYLSDYNGSGEGKILFDAAKWTLVSPLHAAFTMDSTLGYVPFTTTFRSTSAGNPEQFHWDLDEDGVTDSDSSTFTGTIRHTGLISPRLTIRTGHRADSVCYENTIQVIDTSRIHLFSVADRPNDQGGVLQAQLLHSYYEKMNPPLHPTYYAVCDTGSGPFRCDSLPSMMCYSTQWNINVPAISIDSLTGSFLLTIEYGSPAKAVSETYDVLTTDDIAPDAPQNLSVTVNMGTEVLLNWDEVAAEDLAGYHIYRSNYSSIYPITRYLIGSTAATSFTDTTVVSGRSYYYLVAAVDIHDNISEASEILRSAVVGIDDFLPAEFSLAAPYPNPFNTTVTLSFNLPQSQSATLIVYNIQGQQVWKQDFPLLSAGSHTWVWNGRDRQNHELSSGLYLLQLSAGLQTARQKLILLK